MRVIKYLLFFSALIGLLALLKKILHLPDYLLPSPLQVATAFWTQASLLWSHTLTTLFEIMGGFFAGTLLGILFALFLAYFKRTGEFTMPLLILSQTIPVFAIAPLLILWFGYGEASKIIITILMIFFPVTSNFYEGLQKTPMGFLQLAKSMNATYLKTFWHIRVPAAIPHLRAGILLAAVFAPMGAIIGEWVGSSHGLGFLMLYANASLNTPLLFAILIELMLICLLLYYGVKVGLGKLWKKYLV
jgi:putative hydroxymethylpyrimidine transport system permease protein